MLTPMMAAYLLQAADARGARRAALDDAATCGWVDWCLTHRVQDARSRRWLFFVGSIALIPLLPTGFIPPDDLLADPGLPRAAARHARSQQTLRRGRAGARACVQQHPHVKQRLHHDRRRHRRRRPVRHARRGRGAQGDADHQLTPRGERAAAQAGDRARAARAALARAARRAHHGRPGRLGREVHPGADRRRTAARCSRRPRGGARPAHHSRPRQRRPRTASLVRPELVVRPDFARAADLGVTTAGDRRHAAHRHHRRLRPAPAQAQPAAAPGADRGEAAARGAPGPGAARAPARCRARDGAA